MRVCRIITGVGYHNETSEGRNISPTRAMTFLALLLSGYHVKANESNQGILS